MGDNKMRGIMASSSPQSILTKSGPFSLIRSPYEPVTQQVRFFRILKIITFFNSTFLSDIATSLFPFNTKLLERVVCFHSSFPYLLLIPQASALNLAFETVLTKIINDLTL